MQRIISENFWGLLVSFLAVALCVCVFAQMFGEYWY